MSETPRTLADTKKGDVVVVERLQGDARKTDRLTALGLLPGISLTVKQIRPVFVVEAEELHLALERDLAALVCVG